MDTRWLDARFEEIETKLLDLHRRMVLIEELLKDDIEAYLEDKGIKTNEKDNVQKEGGKDGKSRQKQRETEE